VGQDASTKALRDFALQFVAPAQEHLVLVAQAVEPFRSGILREPAIENLLHFSSERLEGTDILLVPAPIEFAIELH